VDHGELAGHHKDMLIVRSTWRGLVHRAFDIKTGKSSGARRVRRSHPSQPDCLGGSVRTEILTVARILPAADPATGRACGDLANRLTHATPIPVMLHDLIFIANGLGGTIQPIYAMRQSAGRQRHAG
jgi:hypothetical protein